MPHTELAMTCRNVTIAGRRTSVRIENVFWAGLDRICKRCGCSVDALMNELDRRVRRLEGSCRMNLTAATRILVTALPAETLDALPSNDVKALLAATPFRFAGEARMPDRDEFTVSPHGPMEHPLQPAGPDVGGSQTLH